ncbi:MAG: hypothetical protein J0H29_19085 [Sphingobacteriales bacterium]|nr:hypothetical protein [Sphingobacteriales bacterium]OJY87325.1 MAG: hypothetical protein BGP14_09485 [Sphingobacteriales bacterium 44-15]
MIIGVLFVCAAALGQQASLHTTVNKDRLLIGEQVKLDIICKLPAGASISGWVNLPDTFNHLEIVDRSPIDSSLEGSVKTYRQSFTITGFDSGVWVVPPVALMADKQKISSAPLSLAVVPVHLTDSAYHDIRDIIDVPVKETSWWYWIAGALSLILIGILVWLWMRLRKRTALPLKPVEVKGSPLEEALQQLNELKKAGYIERGEWKPYYSTLTGIFKNYNERRYWSGFLQKTTDEILVTLNQGLPKDLISVLAGTLRVADAVKFAKYRPEAGQAEADIAVMEKTIKQQDNLIA